MPDLLPPPTAAAGASALPAALGAARGVGHDARDVGIAGAQGGPALRGLRVCLVAGTLGRGGAERQLHHLARVLRDAGAVPRVLCLTRGECWEPALRALGVPVTWVGPSPSRVRRLARIVAVLRRERPDVVQAQHFYVNAYVAVAAALLGVPGIGALRSDAVNEVAGTGRVLGRVSLRLPRTIAANSRVGIANAVALGVPARRLVLLPNVVDLPAPVERARPADGTVRVLLVGRLGPEKRVDRLLDALAAVRRSRSVPLQATIVGDGPLRAALERQAAALGVADAVTFAGAADDVARHYRAADLLALTSDWEGTPNVLLEAMAYGLPVVATRVGGVPDVVPVGAGRLVDRDDAAALVDAIGALAADAALRLACGARGRAHVERHHAPAGLAAALSGLYAAAGVA